MNYDLTGWPVIDRSAVRSAFQEVPMEAYPELAAYGRHGVHEGQQGQGGLFFASDMAKRLTLRPGMRVLDLACGVGTTSMFLAREYGVTVFAFDEEVPNSLAARAGERGLGDRVIPIKGDCRLLPFARESFDAVFCMNALFYFGTDDLYPTYLLQFLKRGGEIVVGSPCYRDELDSTVPEELLLEFPACLAVHSPRWWELHFARTRLVEVLHSALHPRGQVFWEDRVRYLLETEEYAGMSPGRRAMILGIIKMLNRDAEGFVSHFILHARKVASEVQAR